MPAQKNNDRTALKAFLSVPSPRKAATTAALTLAAVLGAINFTPALSLAMKTGGLGQTGLCDEFSNVMARESNRAMADQMQALTTARDIFAFAASSRQQLCAGGVNAGDVANYMPLGGYTRVGNLDQIGEGHRLRDSLTTTSHEMLHAYQAKNALVSPEELARRYDRQSNLLASLYMEAAAYAFEARINQEYIEKNPGRRKDLEFSMAGEFLDVYEADMKKTARLDLETRRNLATRAVFEFFLTAPGPALLAKMEYAEIFSEQHPWYKSPERLFAFKQASLEQIKGFTRLPNGFQLYRFDRLPEAGELTDRNYLPVTAPGPTPQKTSPGIK